MTRAADGVFSLDERVDQSQLTRAVSIRGRKGLQATMLDPSSPEQSRTSESLERQGEELFKTR